jgi:hypothetical protein
VSSDNKISGGPEILKIWGVAEILDQFYCIGPEILDQLYIIHTENLGWSRNSGPLVFHSHRKCGAVQKFWTSFITFIQKIWGLPEILYQKILIWSRNSGPVVFHSYRKSGVGPEILDQVYFNHTENLG